MYCEGVHKLIDLYNQTAARMEYNREQAHAATQTILSSILNATVAKELRADQGSQGASGSGYHVETSQPKPCMVESLPKELYEALAAKWGSQDNHNSESHMELEQECSQEHGNYQTAMFRALSTRNQGGGFELDGWIPIVEIGRAHV